MDRPCARGLPGADGSRCKYIETEFTTDLGWQAWDVLTACSGQLRITAAGGVIGIDFNAALAIGHALGYDPVGLAELLPAGEGGLVTAINTRTEQGADG